MNVEKNDIEKLISKLNLDEDVLSEELDSEVHEYKGAEASDINNGGLVSQLQYLQESIGDEGLKVLIKNIGKNSK